MANRLALAFALILMPTAAAAQLSDVGVVVALNHKQYLDVPSLCCPPLAWATFGEGRWRLQVDYLRSYREDEGHGNYPLDDVDGRRSSVQRAGLRIESQHHTNVLVSWRALGRPGDSSVSVPVRRCLFLCQAGGLRRLRRAGRANPHAGGLAARLRRVQAGADHGGAQPLRRHHPHRPAYLAASGSGAGRACRGRGSSSVLARGWSCSRWNSESG